MNRLNVRRGPASFALVAVFGLGLFTHAPVIMLAAITCVTWELARQLYRSRAAGEVPAISTELQEEADITPKMIEAGALELAYFDIKASSFEDGALNIYRAMLRAKTGTCPRDGRFLP